MMKIGNLAIMMLLLAGALGACATAANVSETALRKASFNRIQATPFTDQIEAQICRDSLTQTLGFQHQSLEVHSGVQISQDYQCRANRVIAKVSLKNLNDHPMYCAAFSEEAEYGTWVGPMGFAFFEYSFVHNASHACTPAHVLRSEQDEARTP